MAPKIFKYKTFACMYFIENNLQANIDESVKFRFLHQYYEN